MVGQSARLTTPATWTLLQSPSLSAPPLGLPGLYPLIAWKIGTETTYLCESAVGAAGAAISWARDFGLFRDVDELADLARSVPTTNGVFFVPALGGLPQPYDKPLARAAFVGLSYGTGRAHAVRALLEALCMRVRQQFDLLLSDTGLVCDRVRIDGGVARNAFICDFLAALLQRPLEVPEELDMTVTGAAYLAGLRAGIWADRVELRALRGRTRTIEPDAAIAAMATISSPSASASASPSGTASSAESAAAAASPSSSLEQHYAAWCAAVAHSVR